MAFVLIATTKGDDLFPSRDTVVATSKHKHELETLQEARAAERAEYLACHNVPWWQQEAVIGRERIEEVVLV